MFIAANSIAELQWYENATIWIAFEPRKTFPFAVCCIILLSTPLEHSASWYGAVSKGNRETLHEFSFLRMNISLQHALTLKLKSPQELAANLTWNWGISHYLLTKASTQPPYTPFTLSLCQNGSEQPGSPSLLLQHTQCVPSVSLGEAGCFGSWSCKELLPFIFCHYEKQVVKKVAYLVPCAQDIA